MTGTGGGEERDIADGLDAAATSHLFSISLVILFNCGVGTLYFGG